VYTGVVRFCDTCGRLFEASDVDVCPIDGTTLKPLQTEQDADLVGTTIDGRFRVDAYLGSGGFGAVFRAHQTQLGRDVALKVILGRKNTPDLVRRFMLEARATSQLTSVHTVTPIDFGQAEDGTLYLALELLQGETLQQRLDRETRLDGQVALRIVEQLARSVGEAHDKGILHRDLKPANVFLLNRGDGDAFVKVLDFGIAKLQDEGATTITGSGLVVGTPRYTSPEQAKGEEVDRRTDLYSLGVVLFECLTGRAPFIAKTPLGTLLHHCQSPVPRLTDAAPGLLVPAGVQQLVDELLAKDPDERIPDADTLRDRCLKLLEGEPLAPAAVPSVARPPRWGLAGALAVAAVAGIAWAFVSLVGSPPPTAATRSTPAVAVSEYTPDATDAAATEDVAPALVETRGPEVREASPDAGPDTASDASRIVAKVVLASSPPGAEVFDATTRASLGTTPFELPSPQHPLKVVFKREGHQPLAYQVEPGRTGLVSVALSKGPTPRRVVKKRQGKPSPTPLMKYTPKKKKR